MDSPLGPSQPSQQSNYNQATNPSSQTNSEKAQCHPTSTMVAPSSVDHRQPHDIPSTHSNSAVPSSLSLGDTGPLKEKNLSASESQNHSVSELEGGQIHPPGEGDVAGAVMEKKFGGHGEEGGLMEGIDEKTKEHRQVLHTSGKRTGAEIEQERWEDWTGRKSGVDLGKALGGRGTALVLAADG